MTIDDRDRRDWPDEDSAERSDEVQGPPREPESTGEPVTEPAAPDETSTWSSPPSETPAQPPEGEPRAAWPTQPPAADDTRADAWPTAPPERGDEPILEPASEPAHEAPPSEVEAYPADTAIAPATGAAAAGAGAGAHAVPAAESATGESTQCPRCGTENRPGLAFCRNCGQRLVAAGVAATVERPGAPDGTVACPRCGTHNRTNVAFCQNCGANLRGTSEGYVPPAVAGEAGPARVAQGRAGAVLGPVVLLIGLVGLVTAYLLPFAYGTGSLFERAWASDGYGVAFWSGYPDGASLADQAYFGLAAPVPIFGALLVALAVAGFVRAVPGMLQTIGLVVALIWSVGLAVLFLVVELLGNWDGDIVGLLRVLTPAGIILFLTALIVIIGSLTRFARS